MQRNRKTKLRRFGGIDMKKVTEKVKRHRSRGYRGNVRCLWMIFLTLFTLPTMAQEVTMGKVLKKMVKDKQDSTVENIVESWRLYISTHSKAQESTAEMWVNRDTSKFLASYNGKIEKNYDHEIFRIDSFGNGEYSFSVKAVYRGKTTRKKYGLRSINYYVYAIETKDGFKFMAPLDYGVYKNKIIRKSCGLVDFYFPSDLNYSETDLKQSSEFIESLVTTFKLEDITQINYVVAEHHTYAYAKNLAGIMMYDDKRSSGVNAEFVYPNTILAGVPCHKHELTHAVFYQHYPNAHRLVHEGLAAYMDPDSALKYQIEEHLNKIQKIKDVNDLSALLQTDTQFYYTLGRYIIKTIFERDGSAGVLELLKLETDEEVYELFTKVFH